MTEQAHAEFETWWARQPHREQFEDVKEQMRNVWVASRQEAVIELPGKYDKAETQGAEAWNLCHDCCANAVKAAGFKVKE
jgi:hypothetical protein